jgi:hypothetical protein
MFLAPSKTPCSHPPLSPAIQRCCDARNQVLAILDANPPTEENPAFSRETFIQAMLAKTANKVSLLEDAAAAFCSAMPELNTRQGVRDYITCVLHGISIGVIDPAHGTKYLYGAQVAGGFLPSEQSSATSSLQKPAENPTA